MFGMRNGREKKRKIKEYELNRFHSITLRKSGMNAKSWDYICAKFGIKDIDSKRVLSVTIDSDVDGEIIITSTYE